MFRRALILLLYLLIGCTNKKDIVHLNFDKIDTCVQNNLNDLYSVIEKLDSIYLNQKENSNRYDMLLAIKNNPKFINKGEVWHNSTNPLELFSPANVKIFNDCFFNFINREESDDEMIQAIVYTISSPLNYEISGNLDFNHVKIVAREFKGTVIEKILINYLIAFYLFRFQ